MAVRVDDSEKIFPRQYMREYHDSELQNHIKAQEPTLASTGSWRRILRLLGCCLLLTALFWLLPSGYQWRSSLTVEETALKEQMGFDFDAMADRRIQYESCSSIVAATSHQFEFNFTDDATANHWYLLDSSPSALRDTLRGRIIIDRGTPLQESDMDVRVIIKTSDKMHLDDVHFNRSSFGLDVDYKSMKDSNVCTEVEILVFLRPWPRRSLDRLSIRTSLLNIWFKPSLNWEINNLEAHTSHGDFTMDSRQSPVDPLVAHNVTVTSIDGVIFGWFIPDKHLELRNIAGQIGIYICPGPEPYPFDPKNISISTVSGALEVRIPYRDSWPAKAYNHTTMLETISGRIFATIPHGSHTNISSATGSIRAAIIPYGAIGPDAMSEIYTMSPDGDTWFFVYNPPKEVLDKYLNPLSQTLSKHEVGNGQLRLRYPYAWWGEMEARFEHGEVDFDGSSLDYVERGDGYVKARRGTRGRSLMEAHVANGSLDVRLGLQ